MGRNLKVRAHYTRGVRRFGPGFVGPLFIGRPHSVASYLVRAAVRAAAPVNMVSFIMQGGCQCENAPGLRIGTSNVEIAAMMAPRPMLLVSATGDWTRNVPREEYPAIRSIYELYKQPDNVAVVQFQAEHNYNQRSREAVYGFFAKQFLGADGSQPVWERGVEAEPLDRKSVV